MSDSTPRRDHTPRRVQARSTTQQGATTSGDEHRRRGGWLLLLALVALVAIGLGIAAIAGAFNTSTRRSSGAPTQVGPRAPVTDPSTGAGNPSTTPTSEAAAPTTAASPPATTGAGGTGSTPGGNALPANGLVGGAAVTPTNATGKLALPGTVGDVLFAEDGTQLDADALTVIKTAAAEIRTKGTTTVDVIGYTDTIGDAAANKALSLQRAEAVLQALRPLAPAGTHFAAIARGQTKPVAPDTTPAGRQLDRRVTITGA